MWYNLKNLEHSQNLIKFYKFSLFDIKLKNIIYQRHNFTIITAERNVKTQCDITQTKIAERMGYIYSETSPVTLTWYEGNRYESKGVVKMEKQK